MLRPLLGLTERDLERHLLQRGVGELSAGRHACADCGRTPLVGERVHRFRGGALICELCRSRREDVPERSYVVHHTERGLTVRRRAA